MPEPLIFKYELTFVADGRVKEFEIRLDPETLELIHKPAAEPPGWAELKFNRCPNCTLDESSVKYCPVAANMREIIEFFSDLKSTEVVRARVTTARRTYERTDQLQTVVGSIMGIYMPTSGCPILSKMRPMVATHLPFASWEETSYRFIGFYLMAQYFRSRAGKAPDHDFKSFGEFIDAVDVVNVAFSKRLNAARTRKDAEANLNAINILNSASMLARLSIEQDGLASWEKIFKPFWVERE